MSLEKLIEAGGAAVGGVVYVGRVAMGSFTADGFVLTESGKTFLGAENAPAEPPAVQPSRSRKKAAAEEVAKPEAPAEDAQDNLGGLLP